MDHKGTEIEYSQQMQNLPKCIEQPAIALTQGSRSVLLRVYKCWFEAQDLWKTWVLDFLMTHVPLVQKVKPCNRCSVVWIRGDIGWQFKGNYSPRNKSKPNLGPDWSLGSTDLGAITMEPPENLTLNVGIQGNYADSAVIISLQDKHWEWVQAWGAQDLCGWNLAVHVA